MWLSTAAYVDGASVEPSDTSDTQAQTDASQAQAREAFARARVLAAEEQYEDAIAAFEEALALRPSPGLHYNIAVCHHRLMLGLDEKSEAYEGHRAAAVGAYNAYLDAAPQASDRYAVAATIADLGGRPNLLDEWRVDADEPTRATLELRDDDAPLDQSTPEDGVEPADKPTTPEQVAATDPAEFDEPVQPLTPPTTQPRPPSKGFVRAGFPHGYLGVGFSVDTHGPAHRVAEVESLPLLGFTLRMGGYLGRQRVWGFGGELSYAAMPSRARRAHRVGTGQLLFLADWMPSFGRNKRIELGPGLLAGGAVQSLSHAGPTTAICSLARKGIITRRVGLVAGARFNLLVRLNAKGTHTLTMRTGPMVASFANGSMGLNCENPISAFEQFGLRTTQLLVRTDLGYAFRW